MITWLRKRSSLQEGIFVFTIGLGFFIFNSAASYFYISGFPDEHWTYQFKENGHIFLLVYEVLAMILIAGVLIPRGWKLNDINLRFSWRALLHGFVIVVVTILAISSTYLLVTSAEVTSPESKNAITFGTHQNYLIWMLIIIINSVFEEFLYVGYLSKWLNHDKPAFIIISTTLRVLVHIYQGTYNLIMHLIIGIVFSAYYTRYKLLLSLIIAHGLWNLLFFLRS